MLNTKNIKEEITKCLGKDENGKSIEGNSLLFGTKIEFNPDKLSEEKHNFALFLDELKVNEKEFVSLHDLTYYRNEMSWNYIQTADDVNTLDLLVAIADAYGYISNDETIQKENAKRIGKYYELVLSPDGKKIINNDMNWVKIVRECISKNIVFQTNPEKIYEGLNSVVLDDEDFTK